MRRCASCLARFEPKSTGRPPRYCSNRCRQAGFRRITKLRPRGVEAILLEHGMDGAALRGLVASCLRTELAKYGARLSPERFEEALDHLVLVALTLVERYDPARSSPNYTFRSYLWDMVARRLIDWWRRELGDSRRTPESHEAWSLFKLPLSFDALEGNEDFDRVPTVDPEEQDIAAALEELGSKLSGEGRETLATIARPIAEGWGPAQVARDLGVPLPAVTMRMRRLREELKESR